MAKKDFLETPILPENVSEVRAIRELIQPYINNTPVLQNDELNRESSATLFFKCENFQKIGAFKARGAVHAVLRLSEAQRRLGVATHSSGNHAQALAYAAKLVGTKATIVMPENSAQIKINGVKQMGGEIVWCEANPRDREATLQKVLEDTGSVFIPPFNHEWVIGGQATVAAEMLEEINDLDVLIAPIGGGGLLSGTSLAASILKTAVRVYGAEPENVNDAFRSMKSGKIEENPPGNFTIADGLRTNLGPITFSCIKKHVQDIFMVTEEEIVVAMKKIWEKLKITAEPSSAVALAAVLKNPGVFSGKRIGIIVSGGNVDLTDLPFSKKDA